MGSEVDLSRTGGDSAAVDCSETTVPKALADVSVLSEGVEVDTETEFCDTGLLDSDLTGSSGVFFGSFIEYFFCGTVVFAGDVDGFRGICLSCPSCRDFQGLCGGVEPGVICCSFSASAAPVTFVSAGAGTGFW